MNEQIQPKPMGFYTSGWALFGTLLGGPLAGTFYVYQNYKNLGDSANAKKSILIGVLFTIAIMILFTYVNIPGNAGISIGAAVVVKMVISNQEKIFLPMIASGHKKQSGWIIVGISILAVLATLALALGLGLILPDPK